MKINFDPRKIKLPDIDWQKYTRMGLGILLLLAFAYSGYLIRKSQAIEMDQAYLKQQQAEFKPQSLMISQDKIDALGKKQPIRSAGRNPLAR